MTTRRSFLALSGGALAALAGCRSRQATAVTPVPDVLLAGARDGVVRLAGAASQSFGAGSVLSRDGAIAYAVEGDHLVRIDAATGASLQKQPIGGGWMPRVVAESGQECVLAPDPAADPPPGRAMSPLLVAGKKLTLPGCVEPDAFTADGQGLFVLDWLPASKPDHYRVRLLSLADGQVSPLFTRDKRPVPEGAEEQMRGRGRQAVYSRARQTLYTLYTHQPEHQHTRDLLHGTRSHVHAFVHVLHLSEQWAYCLDLPDPFGQGPAEGHALAVDGQRIAVLDTASGSIAYAGAESLAIERVVRIPAGKGRAGLVFGEHLYAADGATVHVLDGKTPAATWTLPAAVRGLRLSPDGSRLYAGGDNEVVWLDAASGSLRGRVRVDGLTDVLSVK
ncbi:hypothetical protein Aab01nite_72860 [Paractinoplanes abujensis]|uniref:Uncharacterized protein n=1 Tax=Paractinoplanes abujensis TaxID=882441 RepID=A0A7W7CUK1_9ACTN|nr:hypothetical protein [Actinoplanes abujensis]MBB4694964.1 hypothetical protein [Actinoplanes abujensis]GID23696.1 hypothetical protein Aab01nite_72860 [Actinoplanes abujensis]